MIKAEASSDLPFNRRQAGVAERRQRILAAARDLLSEGGMEALSMRKLAERAQLSVPTLYNLFGKREDILKALVIDAIDRMDAILAREAPLEDPLERCRAVVTVSIRHIVELEAIFRPMLVAAHHGLASWGLEEDALTARAVRMQAVAIEAAVQGGQLRDLLDPTLLGHQIFFGFELASLRWAFGALDEDGFRNRALYGLYVALLGVASPLVRPGIERELRKLERELGAHPRRPRARTARSS